MGPSPRQQAGYIKRLLRRGEIEVVDPLSGRPIPALVTLSGSTIRITPSPERLFEAKLDDEEDARWSLVFARLRSALSLEAAEELTRAVELESGDGR